jgi:adenylate cyclase, class 2
VLEIEIKARVQNPRLLQAQLDATEEFLGEALKKDRYYCQAGAENQCSPERDRIPRLRLSGDHSVLTVKRKRVEDGVEINEENEVNVSDFDDAEKVLEALGFHPFIEKEKHTRLYKDADGTSIELNTITHLGHFLELELLLPDDSSAQSISGAKDLLRSKILTFGLVPSDIESRPYMALIRELGEGQIHP